MYMKSRILKYKKLRHAIQNGLQICEGISSSSFCVKKLDINVHEKYFADNHIKLLDILYPKSLANLVIEMGTSHQILF